MNIVFNEFCFFRMYEELWHRTLREGSGYSVSRPTPGVLGWDDYEGMERVIEAKENKREEYLLLKNLDEAAIEERLHRAYEENLKLIKRRLKLTPDCSDTIWDRTTGIRTTSSRCCRSGMNVAPRACTRGTIPSTLSDRPAESEAMDREWERMKRLCCKRARPANHTGNHGSVHRIGRGRLTSWSRSQNDALAENAYAQLPLGALTRIEMIRYITEQGGEAITTNHADNFYRMRMGDDYLVLVCGSKGQSTQLPSIRKRRFA